MVAPKLLMLKEYLELDHDDDDGLVLGGGGGVVTVRSLLDAELREKTDEAVRDAATATGNGNALGKFSAAIEAVKRRAAFSVLSWKKRKKQRPAAAAEQKHRFPSPDTAAAAEAKEEYSPSENEEEEEEEATIATPSPATEFQGKVKEEEEEEGFYRSLDYIERATEQMLHRIRRFEMLAEVDPAAECCSRSSDGECEEEEEEEEERAWELLGRLKTNPPPRGGEKLLLDFFIQGGKGGGGGGVPLRQRPRQVATTTTTKEMLRAARRWIDGRPGGEAAEQDSGHGEAATLREMERDGRWRCFHEEEEELGLQVGDEMIQSLVEDIVKELA